MLVFAPPPGMPEQESEKEIKLNTFCDIRRA